MVLSSCKPLFKFLKIYLVFIFWRCAYSQKNTSNYFEQILKLINSYFRNSEKLHVPMQRFHIYTKNVYCVTVINKKKEIKLSPLRFYRWICVWPYSDPGVTLKIRLTNSISTKYYEVSKIN